MPACYIGTSCINAICNCQSVSASGATLSYTAPAGVQYAVVTISESGSVSGSAQAGGQFVRHCIQGVAISAVQNLCSAWCAATYDTASSSNKTTIMLKPSNTFSFTPTYSAYQTSQNCTCVMGSYRGVMSVYEVC